MSLWPGLIGLPPFGELVQAAVHNFGFVTIERFAFGKQSIEPFACNDEFLYLFLDRHGAFLPVMGTHSDHLWMWGELGVTSCLASGLPILA